MNDSQTYSIGAFAQLAGVTVRTLHFYDEAGLLKPSRQMGNQRRQYQQADWLRDRAMTMTPEQVELGARAWEDLYAGFRAVRHLSPEHPDVQALAARMHQLGAMFTEGRPEIEAALGKLYSDISQIPEALLPQGHDQDLQDFMNQALLIYRQKGEPS